MQSAYSPNMFRSEMQIGTTGRYEWTALNHRQTLYMLPPKLVQVLLQDEVSEFQAVWKVELANRITVMYSKMLRSCV